MIFKSNNVYITTYNLCLFFTLSLLLATKNFSVIAVVLLLLTSIVYLIHKRKDHIFEPFDWLVIFILSAYFVSNIPSFFMDNYNTRYFKGSIRYLCFIPIYFFIKEILSTNNQSKEYIELGSIVGSIGTVAIALYQFYILGIPRVGGFLYSINFAYLSCSLSFLALTLSRNSKYRLMLLLAFFLAGYATLLTQTRGAIFAIPILLLFTLFFYKKEKRSSRILTCFIALFLFSSVSYIYSENVQERVQFTLNEFTEIAHENTLDTVSSDAISSGTRLQLWYSAIQSFKESPIIGQTFSQREEMIHTLYKTGKIGVWATGITRGHAHNQYFEMLAGSGILGIIAAIAILIIPLVFFAKYIYKSQYALSGFILVLGFSIFGLTEVPLEQNLISSYYGLMLITFICLVKHDLKSAGENR